MKENAKVAMYMRVASERQLNTPNQEEKKPSEKGLKIGKVPSQQTKMLLFLFSETEKQDEYPSLNL